MRLLISVRDALEARIVLDAGVDLLDVKEPHRGALGRADADQIASVVSEAAGRTPVSVALGELFLGEANSPLGEALRGVRYAKYGLAGAVKIPHWQERWGRVLAELPEGMQGVGVAYVDWRTCAAPPPAEVVEGAIAQNCAAVLFDTFDKSRGGLLAQMPLDELNTLLRVTQTAKLLAVIGGSLDEAAIRTLIPLEPDVVAVRTAVCRGPRAGQIAPKKVKKLSEFVSSTAGQKLVKMA